MTEETTARSDDAEQPVPESWRPNLEPIVAAFADCDHGLARGVARVEPVSAETAEQIQQSLADYGATLTALPPETWDSSVAARAGSRWDVLVDLWTEEEGRSDLVLHAQVAVDDDGPRVAVYLVYVP